jgi:hypothetical protein
MAVSVTVATAALAANVDAPVQAPASVRRSEVRRDLPLSKFYNTPDPFPASKPGALIRSQTIEQYDIPYSVSAVRILYHSRSASGEDVAASGVVLFPYDKKPPAGGWPVIAWAHSFAGSGGRRGFRGEARTTQARSRAPGGADFPLISNASVRQLVVIQDR